jgi:NAD(P)-dependent dehydrogenase (short-subunit alcohol dehydrogenase family)
MEADLLSEKDTEDLAARVLRDYDDLDSAVLLVGGFAMGKLADTSNEDLDKMIRLNFYTALNVVRPLLRHFLQRPGGGRFVLVGSRPGLDAAAGKDFFAYSLSKAMVFKLAEFIDAEGKGKNVDAVVIVPSTIDTEANRKAMPDADFSKWVTPEVIAETISFYLSPEGRMIREAIVKVYNRS